MPVRAARAALILIVVFIFGIGANEPLFLGIVLPAEASVAQHPTVIFIRYPAYEEDNVRAAFAVRNKERGIAWGRMIIRGDTPVDLGRTQSLIGLQLFGPWRNPVAVSVNRIDRVEPNLLRVVWATISHGYHDLEIIGDLDPRRMKTGPMCGEEVLMIERSLLVDQDCLPVSNAYLSGHDYGLASVDPQHERSDNSGDDSREGDNYVGYGYVKHRFVPRGILAPIGCAWGALGICLAGFGRGKWTTICGAIIAGSGPVLILIGWMLITAWNEGLI